MIEKKYFKIGEVCKLANVKPHVLRYWEKEIKDIKPERSLKNQRLYSRQTLDKIIEIKNLLDKGYKLEAVKSKIGKEGISKEDKMKLFLIDLKRNLQIIRNLLE